MGRDGVRIAVEALSDRLGGHPGDDSEVVDILGHHRPRGDDRAFADPHPGQHHAAKTDPHIVADIDPVLRQRRQCRIAADPAAIAEQHPGHPILMVDPANNSDIVGNQHAAPDATIHLHRAMPADKGVLADRQPARRPHRAERPDVNVPGERDLAADGQQAKQRGLHGFQQSDALWQLAAFAETDGWPQRPSTSVQPPCAIFDAISNIQCSLGTYSVEMR